MKVILVYHHEFGHQKVIIDVEEIPRYAKRFRILSVRPYVEEELSDQESD